MASSSVQVYTPLKKLEWSKQFEKKLVRETVVGQLSNRMEKNQQVSNKGTAKVPNSVINTRKVDFAPGTYSVTMPMLEKLDEKGQGGSQSVKGKEEKPGLRWKSAFYNVQRKGVTIAAGDVEGDLTLAYDLAEQKTPLLLDFFAELEDYNFMRSIALGGDEFLTEAEYWTGETLTSAPVAAAVNSNVLYAGQTSLVTWNATAATYAEAVRDALNAWTDATAVMTKARLDNLISWCHRNLVPIGMSSPGGRVDYVILLTQYQADQLASDSTAASGWLAIHGSAAARGDDNKAITGILGTYRRTLLLVNPRDITFDCGSATQTDITTPALMKSAFSFVSPWNSAPARQVKGNVTTPANAGTAECALVLGRSAVLNPEPKTISFNQMEDDYGFVKGFEARRSCGHQRAEWYTSADTSSITAKPYNQGSALFFTPTPALWV